MNKTLWQRMQSQTGLTLIEVVVAIVLIGVALPTLTVHFSGIRSLNQPEFFTQATFLGARQIEGLANETLASIPAAGSYDCATFRDARVGGGSFDIDCSSTVYLFNWRVDNVAANAVDTPSGSATFGKRIRLTVTRQDGEMPAFNFYTLF